MAMKPPPPGPATKGSVTPSVLATATAASMALPPALRVLIPALLALNSADATAPPVPTAPGSLTSCDGRNGDGDAAPNEAMMAANTVTTTTGRARMTHHKHDELTCESSHTGGPMWACHQAKGCPCFRTRPSPYWARRRIRRQEQPGSRNGHPRHECRRRGHRECLSRHAEAAPHAARKWVDSSKNELPTQAPTTAAGSAETEYSEQTVGLAAGSGAEPHVRGGGRGPAAGQQPPQAVNRDRRAIGSAQSGQEPSGERVEGMADRHGCVTAGWAGSLIVRMRPRRSGSFLRAFTFGHVRRIGGSVAKGSDDPVLRMCPRTVGSEPRRTRRRRGGGQVS